MFDLFNIIIMVVPVIVLYITMDHMLAYHAKNSYLLRYRGWKDSKRIKMYLAILLIGLLGILVSLPFVVLAMFNPL